MSDGSRRNDKRGEGFQLYKVETDVDTCKALEFGELNSIYRNGWLKG